MSPTELYVREGEYWRRRRDGSLYTPDDPPPPPPPPPPSSVLAFGTTLFGQSYDRYKSKTISSSSARYNASENDTPYTLNGVARKGGAVTREYSTSGIGTWTTAHPSFKRQDQPTIYSFKTASTVTRTSFKDATRTWLRSKNPATTSFCWLAYHHEWDNDGTPGDTAWNQWFDRNAAIREVLEEAEFSSRTDVRFGFISTGTPFQANLSRSNARHWRNIWDQMVSTRGGTDTWDYIGADRYNNQWNDSSMFVDLDNAWFTQPDAAYAYTGLPFVLGEMSTARPWNTTTNSAPGGRTKAELETLRTAWLRDLMQRIRERGYFDAAAWWRVPATSSFDSAFSTIMGTPTGYDAQLAAGGFIGPPLGFDAPTMVSTHAEFMVTSIQEANDNFAAGAAPHTISFQP